MQGIMRMCIALKMLLLDGNNPDLMIGLTTKIQIEESHSLVQLTTWRTGETSDFVLIVQQEVLMEPTNIMR